MEHYGATMDAEAIAFGGTQRIISVEGYKFNLLIKNRLAILRQDLYQ